MLPKARCLMSWARGRSQPVTRAGPRACRWTTPALTAPEAGKQKSEMGGPPEGTVCREGWPQSVSAGMTWAPNLPGSCVTQRSKIDCWWGWPNWVTGSGSHRLPVTEWIPRGNKRHSLGNRVNGILIALCGDWGELRLWAQRDYGEVASRRCTAETTASLWATYTRI